MWLVQLKKLEFILNDFTVETHVRLVAASWMVQP